MEGKRGAWSDESHQDSQALNTKTLNSQYKYLDKVDCKANSLYKTDSLYNTHGRSDEDENLNKFLLLDTLEILFTNADCLSNKRDDLLTFLNSLATKPNIIAITEVNSKSNLNKMQESEFSLEGYNLFACHVGENKYRGIIVYVDKRLVSSLITCPTNFDEALFILVKDIANKYLVVGTFYRSPNCCVENDIRLCETITYITNIFSGNKLLLGDFNYPRIEWSNWSVPGDNAGTSNEAKFLMCLRENLYLQHVTMATRARGLDTPHLLDLVLSNDPFVGDIFNFSPLGKGDHSVLKFSCNLSSKRFTSRNKFNYSKSDYNGLRSFMGSNLSPDLFGFLEDINVAWCAFKQIMNDGIKQFIPLSKNRDWRKKPSWRYSISQTLKQNIRKKHRLWTRFQETKSREIETQYKIVRNIVRNETRKINNLKQRDIATSCKVNPKKFWQHVKSKTGTQSGIGIIKEAASNGEVIALTDDTDKANAFVNYFSTVFVQERLDNIATMPQISILNTMLNINISECQIYQKLIKLKN